MAVNDALKNYPGNWVLSEQGYIKSARDKGREPLLDRKITS